MTLKRKRWRRIRRVAFLVFLAVVAYLLVRAARAIDWAQVGQTLAGYSAATVFKACAITVASYLVYGGYELAARRDARHHLPAPRVMSMAAVAYAFSLNLGALLGGAGFRYRLYSRAGMGLATVGRVVAFVLVTSWVGYLTLAGALFVSGQVRPPPDWRLSGEALPWLGAGMLLLVAIYLVACQRMHGRVLHFRGRHFRLPSLPLALLQVVLSATNWALMALLVFVLMPPGVDFPSVLGALLVAAVASAIAHVPAGLGVMEAVFIPLLDHQASQSQLLAALLAYRAFYYLGPLVLAAMGYAVLERRAPAGAVGSGRGE